MSLVAASWRFYLLIKDRQDSQAGSLQIEEKG